MLDGYKILQLLYKKHKDQFLFLAIHLTKDKYTLADLIVYAEELSSDKVNDSHILHIKHFCLPLLKQIGMEYYNNPNEFIHLETR